MSLLDLVAAAAEEFIGLRVLGAAHNSVDAVSARRRLRRGFGRATTISLFACGICWAAAWSFPGSALGSAAGYGVYGAIAIALFSALGWAYALLAIRGPTRRRTKP